MSPEAQRIAIADACGWTVHTNHGAAGGVFYSHDDHGTAHSLDEVPDYLADLNAMHEAETHLSSEHDQNIYGDELRLVINRGTQWRTWRATAAQRAKAFLRTLNKWDDSK